MGVHTEIGLVIAWLIVLLASTISGESSYNETVTVGGASFLFLRTKEVAVLTEENDLAKWLVAR